MGTLRVLSLAHARRPQPTPRRPDPLQRHQPLDLPLGKCSFSSPRSHSQNLRGIQEEVRRTHLAQTLLPLREHHFVAGALLQVLGKGGREGVVTIPPHFPFTWLQFFHTRLKTQNLPTKANLIKKQNENFKRKNPSHAEEEFTASLGFERCGGNVKVNKSTINATSTARRRARERTLLRRASSGARTRCWIHRTRRRPHLDFGSTRVGTGHHF